MLFVSQHGWRETRGCAGSVSHGVLHVHYLMGLYEAGNTHQVLLAPWWFVPMQGPQRAAQVARRAACVICNKSVITGKA